MGFTLPFLNGTSLKKRSQVIAVDLGSRTTKAVLLERRGDGYALLRYALMDAPIFEKKISAELMSDHLHTVATELGGTTKFIAVAVGLGDAVVRQVELPPMPIDEMRSILKMNHKNYLQQDLPNHAFDCCILPQNAPPPGEKKPEANRSGAMNPPNKFRVLVAASKQQMVSDFMQAAAAAGLVGDALVPALIGPINAFEKSLPEIFSQETVALVDVGFKHTSVCVLDRGELATIRTVNIGGDQLTAGLAEVMNISYAEAEGIKVGMAPEVESALLAQVTPLGREIRASLDFFEHQQDRPVTEVYLSGGSTSSEMIVQMLHADLLADCKIWNPTRSLQMALSGQQAVEIEHVGPQLTVAIGTALAAY